MSFQVIFDRAETISINRRAVVAQTTSRNQTVRSVSRGGQIWRFEVKLPDGIPWTELRSHIEAIDYADKYTSGTVNLNRTGLQSWLLNYRGNAISTVGFNGTVVNGSNVLTLTSNPTCTSGNKLAAGDVIQMGPTGKVYSVTADVPFNSDTVVLNRPVYETTGPYVLTVGPSVNWKVICVEMPTWTIFARNQVAWSGPFIFYEYML